MLVAIEKLFNFSHLLGPEFLQAVTRVDFWFRESTSCTVRPMLVCCNLSSPKIQDGFSRLLDRADMKKLKASREKTACWQLWSWPCSCSTKPKPVPGPSNPKPTSRPSTQIEGVYPKIIVTVPGSEETLYSISYVLVLLESWGDVQSRPLALGIYSPPNPEVSSAHYTPYSRERLILRYPNKEEG